MPTLTAFARDHAGAIISSTNASGTSGLVPVSDVDGGLLGYGASPGFLASATIVPQYMRSDGFTLIGGAGSGVQINGVRAYDTQLQSWTTPDAYEGDIHDPASQQRYTWNRGNAVDYSDESGYAPCDGEACIEHTAGKGPWPNQIGRVVARPVPPDSQLMADGHSIREHVENQRAFTGALSEGMMWVLPGGGEARAGYSSFQAFKAVYGVAPKGFAWHHIVEQYQVGKFPAQWIHSPDNLILVDTFTHRKITGAYNRKGVREALSKMPFEQQYAEGIKVLQYFRVLP